MPGSGNVALRQALLDGYDGFVRKLAQRLRSIDQARDAIQDTFLKLETGPDVGPVAKPAAFIMRVATNLAIDRRRTEDRRLTATEVDALIDLPDASPSPADEVEGRSELAAFTRALADLPERRRAILTASLDQQPRKEIARRFGVSERTVDFELKRALDHARSALQREN